MPIWMIFALLSMFSMAAAEFSQKISLTSSKDISAITNNFFIWSLQGILGFILALILGVFSIAFTWSFALKLLVLAILYFIGGALYYTSYKAQNVSISVILGSISSLVSTTLGIIFLFESANWQKFLGVFLVLIAIYLVRFDSGKKFSKNNLYALSGGLVYGLTFTLDKSFIMDGIHPFMYLGLMSSSVAIVGLFFGLKNIRRESSGLVLKDFYPMMMAAIFGLGFNVLTFFAYKNLGSVGKVDAMNNSMIFIVIAGEYLFFKERDNLLKKVVAGLIAVAGMVLFALY